MIGRRRAAFWPPAQAADSLVQLAFVERSLAHIFAGWAVKMPSFEAKRAFAAQMHRSMERATYLRSRVNGLCHAVASQATLPSGLREAMSQVDRAQSPARLLAALYRFVYPRLIALYETHVRETDPVGDRASIELIRSFLPVVAKEMREGRALKPANSRADNRIWFGDLERLWDARSEGERVTLTDCLWPPVDRVPAAVRPEGLQLGVPGSLGLLPADPVDDPQGVGMFLHKELDEEYTTLELIARNSYEHPDMHWQFHRDMARQASDEARHAEIITRLMAARGFRHGDFPLSTSSYDGLYQFEPSAPGSRQELLWRMLIRQTVEEGLAIDNLGHEIARRRSAGQNDIATAQEYILRDEVFHAQSGLHWSRELLGSEPGAELQAREEAFLYLTQRAEAAREAFVMTNLDAAMDELAAVQDGKDRRQGKTPDRLLNRTGRKQAGYSDADIDQVVGWGYAAEPPA